MEFYEVISKLNTNAENHMFTVCSGEHIGEKMITSSEGTVWMSDKSGYFSIHSEDVMTAANNKVTEIDGVKVYSELLGNKDELVICGAGHVSMPVIDMAKTLGFRVVAIDDREQFVSNAIKHGADDGICTGFSEALPNIPGSLDTYFVIVTRGHKYDSDCLLEIVKKPHAYIGMIGSRRKIGMVRDFLIANDVPEAVIDSVHMPIGLDIGAETPEEIAVSILAEIIGVKNTVKRNSGFSGPLLDALINDGRGPAVLASIVSKKGSAPRGAGARMLCGPNGLLAGTIGGGLAEARTLEKAAEMLSQDSREPFVIQVDMTGQEIEDEGMICGGVIEVLLERV